MQWPGALQPAMTYVPGVTQAYGHMSQKVLPFKYLLQLVNHNLFYVLLPYGQNVGLPCWKMLHK